MHAVVTRSTFLELMLSTRSCVFCLVLCLVVFVCLVACVCLPLLDSMCIQPLLAASLPRLLLLLLWGLMGPAYNSLSPGQFLFFSVLPRSTFFFSPGQTSVVNNSQQAPLCCPHVLQPYKCELLDEFDILSSTKEQVI